MRVFITLVLVALTPTLAAADRGLVIGASLSGFEPEYQSTYGGKLQRLSERLGGSSLPHQSVPGFGTHLGYRPTSSLEVQARYRQWSSGVMTDFGPASALDFSYQRHVQSCAAVGRLLFGDGLLRFHVGGGPAVYRVNTVTSGWIGESATHNSAVGGLIDLALAIRIPEIGEFELGGTSEFFSLPHSDVFIQDAGPAGGTQVYAGLTLYL